MKIPQVNKCFFMDLATGVKVSTLVLLILHGLGLVSSILSYTFHAGMTSVSILPLVTFLSLLFFYIGIKKLNKTYLKQFNYVFLITGVILEGLAIIAFIGLSIYFIHKANYYTNKYSSKYAEYASKYSNNFSNKNDVDFSDKYAEYAAKYGGDVNSNSSEISDKIAEYAAKYGGNDANSNNTDLSDKYAEYAAKYGGGNGDGNNGEMKPASYYINKYGKYQNKYSKFSTTYIIIIDIILVIVYIINVYYYICARTYSKKLITEIENKENNKNIEVNIEIVNENKPKTENI